MNIRKIRKLLDYRWKKPLGFKTLFTGHENLLGILFFPTSNSTWERPADQYIQGNLNASGAVTTDSSHYVVTAMVPENSVLVFNMPSVSLSDKPVFKVEHIGIVDEFLTMCRLPLYQDRPCLNCVYMLKDNTISYSIQKSAFDNGEGLYLLKEDSDNINNLLLLCRDGISPNILAIKSKTSNIDDVTVDEVTDIYATINTDYNG